MQPGADKDARLLWQTQYYCRRRSLPHPEDQRGLLQPVTCGCQIYRIRRNNKPFTAPSFAASIANGTAPIFSWRISALIKNLP
jgi:hypothetical protein